MKTKLLYFLLALLIITNLAMVFMLIKKPHKQKKGRGNFLVKELQFDNLQKEQFLFLDNKHRETMDGFDREIKNAKNILFNSFSKPNSSSDSISKKIGVLEGKKEQEVFTFFSNVRRICTAEQAADFDLIIKKLLHKRGRNHPPRGKRMSPPEREGMPPR